MTSYIRRLPLWFRFGFAFLCGAIIVVALVLYVSDHNQPLAEAPANPNKQQEVTELKQERIVVRQQQAPIVSVIGTAGTPATAAAKAITAYMSNQISRGLITGPLDGTASCAGLGGSPSDTVLHCDVVAGDKAKDDSLRYPFDAKVDPASHRVTYCQIVTPPYPLKQQPVSARCT